MNQKRAQITQLFIILAALLVIGATLFLGGKLIYGVINKSCDVNNAVFVKSMSDTLDDKMTYGSRDVIRISAPCDAVALCFVNGNATAGKFNSDSNKIINDSVSAGVKTDIFLQTRDTTLPMGYDPRIILQDFSDLQVEHEVCVPAIGGEFTFKTQGYGRFVRIMT